MSVSFFISVSTAVVMGHVGLFNRGRALCKSSRRKSIRFWQPLLHFRRQQTFLFQLMPDAAHEIGHRFSIALRQTLEGFVERKRFHSLPENRVVDINLVAGQPKDQSSSQQVQRRLGQEQTKVTREKIKVSDVRIQPVAHILSTRPPTCSSAFTTQGGGGSENLNITLGSIV